MLGLIESPADGDDEKEDEKMMMLLLVVLSFPFNYFFLLCMGRLSSISWNQLPQVKIHYYKDNILITYYVTANGTVKTNRIQT